nr:immunoglobulin heavy chain junction region [Mus musculus]
CTGGYSYAMDYW